MFCDNVMRTGAWYGDRPLTLNFPDKWDVTFLWPNTPPPLKDSQIANLLEQPTGQPPIREICKGKSRPLIIVDDLNRPTPAARIMPFLLNHFRDAGIPLVDVRIIMGPAAHGLPPSDAMAKKVGPLAATSCKASVHDWTHNTVKIGTTSYGTPVFVNREVVASDFVLGVGGIYPNDSAGFGGGSKLAIGVLGRRSIMRLHYGHRGAGWGAVDENDFRSDLNEIARMIRMNTMVALNVNAARDVVRMGCGDPSQFYNAALAFSKEAFTAPFPGDADVVISNAYPNDLSLTFVRKKGTTPLRHCAPGASRIVIASCTEGLGLHRLFPEVNLPRFYRERVIVRRLSVIKPAEISDRILSRVRKKPPSIQPQTPLTRKNPLWLYHTGSNPEMLPAQIRGLTITRSWPEILRAIQREQGERENLKVLVFPCAPLQCLEGITPEELLARNSLQAIS